jgi:hypothetical protein
MAIIPFTVSDIFIIIQLFRAAHKYKWPLCALSHACEIITVENSRERLLSGPYAREKAARRGAMSSP